MIQLETSDPSLLRNEGIKLWLTAIAGPFPTALGKVVTSKFLSALPQIALLFKAHLGQGALQVREDEISLSQCMHTDQLHQGSSSADVGLLLQLGAGLGLQEALLLTRAHASSQLALWFLPWVASTLVWKKCLFPMEEILCKEIPCTSASCCLQELCALCRHSQSSYKITFGMISLLQQILTGLDLFISTWLLHLLTLNDQPLGFVCKSPDKCFKIQGKKSTGAHPIIRNGLKRTSNSAFFVVTFYLIKVHQSQQILNSLDGILYEPVHQ